MNKGNQSNISVNFVFQVWKRRRRDYMLKSAVSVVDLYSLVQLRKFFKHKIVIKAA